MATLVLCPSAMAAARSELMRRLSVQLYVVRKEMAASVDGALQAVAAIGLRQVEFAGFHGRDAASIRRSLAGAGLVASGAHCVQAEMADDEIKRQIDFCGAVGIPCVIAASPSLRRWSAADEAAGLSRYGETYRRITLDDWRWNADRCNAIGERVKAAGMRFAFHNHNLEFRSYGGVTGMDELLRLTDPTLVALQFDQGNAMIAGVDPAAFMRRHGERVELLHLKEWRAPIAPTTGQDFPAYVPFGEGRVDWPSFFAAARASDIRSFTLEPEIEEGGDALKAIRLAYGYFRDGRDLA